MEASISGREVGKIVNPGFRLWRGDTRAVVGGVLLAVCFSANMQITERLDTAISGGVIYWFGVAFVNVWFSAACIFYGLTGGLLAAAFNPIIAVLTATSPMAPRFFINNTLWVIPFALMCQHYFRKNGHIDFKTFAWMCVVATAVDGLSFAGSWILLFKFSPTITLGLWLLLIASAIPGSLMGWAFCRTVGRSGIFGN